MLKEKETAIVTPETIPEVSPDPQQGLTEQEAAFRRENGLANGLTQSATRSVKDILRENCVTFFNLVFVVLAVIVAISGSSIKNMTFMIIVIINAIIGCYQEIRAKRAVDKLTLVAAQQLRTVRDAQVVSLRSDLLVRDDIVEFIPGDQICADGVVRAGQLQVNEALVTGEEDAIVKNPGDTLLSGSFVVAGKARAQLTRVGTQSFAARLAAEAKADPHAAKSEMMGALDKLIRVVGFALIPIGLVLFYQQFKILGLSFRESAEGTVSALVGMIPEGLYLLTSIAMAASALKLSQDKVLVQDMNCIETLARVDVLCVDKTGTITEAKMEVENVVPLTEDPPERLEQILAAFYSGQEPENDTAQAMAEMFAGQTDWICTRRVPFTSATKWSGAEFQGRGSFVAGAPEFIMGSRYGELRQSVEEWSAKGYRVLLIAGFTGALTEQMEPGKLRPLALVLLTNRIRPEAPGTFAYFASQGVSIKVISGDNPMTVSEVARRAGIVGAEDFVDVSLLENEEDFSMAVDCYTVFGRVTPDKKRKLIRAFRKQGHTVGMTGDGVNDVLAMKESDCSIAMASGAQAASQVAQLVLLESNFAAMPGIVGEGRRVINNIQRAAALFLVKNIFSLGLSLITFFTVLPYPIVPMHLSVIAALTIGVPSFFLAMEPNYERVTGRFMTSVLRRALPGGLTNIAVVLAAQFIAIPYGLTADQLHTVCAALLGTVGLLVLFQTCRPFGTFRKIIWGAMAVALVFCFTVLAPLFEFHSGDSQYWLILGALILMTPTVFFIMQWLLSLTDKAAEKLRRRKG